jgi:surface antigen
MRSTHLAVPAVLAFLALAACAPGGGMGGIDYGPKQTVGALMGGGVGALAGSRIGSGRGRLVATGVGGVLGALMGSEVGRSLDRADQLAAQRAHYQALEQAPTGSRVAWSNPDSGNRGYVTPVRTYNPGPATVCREYEHTAYIQGRPETVYGTACRGPDGRWQIS